MADDALSAMSAPKTGLRSRTEPGIVYTFYSYKGGVGRSMALANVGVLLALSEIKPGNAPRVLLVDWDLEAPGLEVYFQRSKNVELKGDPQTTPGVLDLLESLSGNFSIPWKQCLLQASFAGVSIDIISSGSKNISSDGSIDYTRRVQQLDWNRLFARHDVGNYFDRVRQEWINDYDYVLIDSRTGITDIGDICTVLMADVLILGFVSNYQNVDGVAKIVARARAARSRLPVDRSHLIAVPVPMRDEVYTEYEKSVEWRAIYAERLGHLFKDWLPKNVTPLEALSRLFIPYFPIWSFGECIPVLENTRERFDPTTIGAAYIRLANLVRTRLDWNSSTGASGTELIQNRAELRIQRDESNKLQDALKKSRSINTKRLLGFMLGVSFLVQFLYMFDNYKKQKMEMEEVSRLLSESKDRVFKLESARNSNLSSLRQIETERDVVLSKLRRSEAELDQLQASLRLLEIRGKSSVPILRASIAPSGNAVVTAHADGSFGVWDASTGRERAPFKAHTSLVVSAAFSPDGARIVTASSSDRIARVWDAATGAAIIVLRGHKGFVFSAAFSPDGGRIVTASYDGTARVWDGATGDEIVALKGHRDAVISAAYSPDGARIVTASSDKTARVWDAATGKEMSAFEEHEDAVRSAAFSPDGRRIVTASSDKTARVWDAGTGALISVLKGHEGPITSASFSPDGSQVVTASDDRTARVWNASSGHMVRLFDRQSSAVTAAAFFPDGLQILVTSYDGSFLIAR